MRMKDLDELTELAIPFFKDQNYIGENVSEKEYKTVKRIVEILREGTHFLKELAEGAAIYYNDDYELPVVNEDMNKKERKSIERMHNAINDETGKASIKNFIGKIENSKEDLTEEEAKALLNETLDEIGEGPGKVLMPLRVVITGQARGAELYQVISIIGRDRTLDRIKNMVKKYNLF